MPSQEEATRHSTHPLDFPSKHVAAADSPASVVLNDVSSDDALADLDGFHTAAAAPVPGDHLLAAVAAFDDRVAGCESRSR